MVLASASDVAGPYGEDELARATRLHLLLGAYVLSPIAANRPTTSSSLADPLSFFPPISSEATSEPIVTSEVASFGGGLTASATVSYLAS